MTTGEIAVVVTVIVMFIIWIPLGKSEAYWRVQKNAPTGLRWLFVLVTVGVVFFATRAILLLVWPK